jgi:molybdopterin synthase catalytic subunit
MTDVQLLSQPLDISSCIEKATDPTCGGMNVFIGTIRTKTQNRKVIRLEYESYIPMAIKEMHKIADDILQKWDVKNIVIHHRTGILKTGDTAVVIVVSAPHREAAFEACRYAIDTLKQTVPIWKKEVFEDGEVWVSAHA